MPAAEAEAFAARQARASAGGKGAAKVANLPTLVSAAGELPIVKMTEKFARSPDKPAELDEARRTFLLEDQAIQVQYHHAPGRITASSRLYTKHNSGVELTTVDPFAPPLTAPQLDADFRAAVQAEKDCISAVKTQQRAVADIIKTRKRQEASALLEKSMFDLALERAKSGPTDDDADTADEVGDKPFDFLAPFLQFVQVCLCGCSVFFWGGGLVALLLVQPVLTFCLLLGCRTPKTSLVPRRTVRTKRVARRCASGCWSAPTSSSGVWTKKTKCCRRSSKSSSATATRLRARKKSLKRTRPRACSGASCFVRVCGRVSSVEPLRWSVYFLALLSFAALAFWSSGCSARKNWRATSLRSWSNS